ncbi:MAG: glutamate formiminotransferase / 5-formyltetrahydrofolate cyclo-ligase [Solirubrobacteraceae bacterium]|jgi:glutamate formiminotransferase/glutamate formiminotransferase/formiminotetrahydrofolate cyclodeaminase|nr:glutamate formiminotransferase / 5-formyltetrahydrofolate cyclo-ligase [Solirubrobacteraceae bacterium]
MLLAVPNVSEGRNQGTVAAIGAAFEAGGARLLDLHVDPDHNRSVYTLAAPPQALAQALTEGAREAARRIDMSRHSGAHPCVGALDVVPVVHLDDARRGAACAEVLVAADEIARAIEVPVLLYGDLGGGRTRSDLRQGGAARLAKRLEHGELRPDFGPPRAHPTAGAVLASARPPLVAFNLLLQPGVSLDDARAIAAQVREGGENGLEGVRAIGLWMDHERAAQVSFNVEQPDRTPLKDVVAAVRARAPVASAELVGLAPKAAFEGFPDDVPLPGFDPGRHLLEHALDYA